MITFIRYLRGYVFIRVHGFSPERFINLCGHKKILLWDIKKEEDIYYMNISLKDFFQIRPFVKKTKNKVAVIQRCGLPFFIPGLLARKIFIIGFLFALCFWWISTFFVWKITVTGNNTITEDNLLYFLEENQVYVGMKKEQLNIKNIEKELRKQFEIITWTSLKLQGTELVITVKENTMKTITTDTQNLYPYGSNLISDVEGQITDMIVRTGVPMVSIGDNIITDDILISGLVPILNEDGTIRKYHYKRADADIYVKHTIDIQETLPFVYTQKQYTGREKKSVYLGIGNKIITLFPFKIKYPYYDVSTSQKQLAILPNLELPLFWGSSSYREYLNSERAYSLTEAQQLLEEKYQQILMDLEEKGVQIIEKNVRIDTDNGKWVLKGDLTVISKIGIEDERVNE